MFFINVFPLFGYLWGERLIRRGFKFSLGLSSFEISLEGRTVKGGFLDFFF